MSNPLGRLFSGYNDDALLGFQGRQFFEQISSSVVIARRYLLNTQSMTSSFDLMDIISLSLSLDLSVRLKQFYDLTV